MKSLPKLLKEYVFGFRVGWFLAVRQIRRSSKWTTALIIFIMVLTFLNLVVVSGLLLGLISGSFEQFRESHSGEVIVTSAPGRDYIENSPGLVSFLESHSQVKAFSPRYQTSGTILGTLTSLPRSNERPNQMGAAIKGLDPEKEALVTNFASSVTQGGMLDGDESGYMLIGANLLKKYSSFADANIPGLDLLADVDVGSRVRVTVTSKGGGTLIVKEFIVKGIVKSKVDEISTRVFVTGADLKSLLSINKEHFQEIAIRTEPSYAEALVADINGFIGPSAARTQTSLDAIPQFLRDIESTMGVLGNALSSIALVVASITIFIVIYINAVTKRKLIGIMKGVGISPAAVQFSYLIQAIFYGLSGSLVGLLLTFGVLEPYFKNNPIDFPFSDGILVVTPAGAAIRVAILIFVTIIAGYLPAKLIVRKNTLDSILGR